MRRNKGIKNVTTVLTYMDHGMHLLQVFKMHECDAKSGNMNIAEQCKNNRNMFVKSLNANKN